MTDSPSGPIYLTEQGASDLLLIPATTLMTWRSRGKGPPYIKIEGTIRYDAAALINWMESHKVTPQRS